MNPLLNGPYLHDTMKNKIIATAAIIGMAGVIMGAFGAHALKEKLPEASLDVIRTGVLYLFVHVLAALATTAMSSDHVMASSLRRSALCFLIGIALFSGSLFLIGTSSLTGIRLGFFGILTPIGGLFFILGWFFLAWWAWQRPNAKTN
jgi:uncharacterized membrane protein YgdD (TMEM256/DUF423 family)